LAKDAENVSTFLRILDAAERSFGRQRLERIQGSIRGLNDLNDWNGFDAEY
jgi:hypothetical protein